MFFKSFTSLFNKIVIKVIVGNNFCTSLLCFNRLTCCCDILTSFLFPLTYNIKSLEQYCDSFGKWLWNRGTQLLAELCELIFTVWFKFSRKKNGLISKLTFIYLFWFFSWGFFCCRFCVMLYIIIFSLLMHLFVLLYFHFLRCWVMKFSDFMRAFWFRSRFMIRVHIFKIEIINVNMLLINFLILFLGLLKA